MERRQLVQFVKLCETGNVTRAANDLFLTRQALSKSIRKMERELGVELFYRNKDGVELTPAGRFLLDFAHEEACHYRDVAVLFDQVLRKMRGIDEKRTVRIGTTLFFAPHSIIQIALNAKNVGPIANAIFANVSTLNDGMRGLRDGDYDLIVMRTAPNERDGFECRRIALTPASVLIKKDSTLGDRDTIDFQNDLRGQTLLCAGEDSYRDTLSFADRFGLKVLSVPADIYGIRQMILSGDGVMVAPEQVCEQIAIGFGGIMFKPCVNYPEETTGFVICPKNAPEYVFDFIRLLESVCS
ncbi:hypothetical protein C1878_04375 [Gordonibacter sp. 28C]|uniref:LysR family transcriptional regulator n=1 Tax=Gordonibacter sp. 28C TaxID=2078569 RepID=UPI000DF778C1|nr:LysR family transcriptional regulator [Gordonibacter sp. 28C]RDB63113.1 hypothetical protein C1878_04375 [Gordonibacter sp. 28C]